MNTLRKTLPIIGFITFIGGLAWLIAFWQQPERFCAECVPVVQVELDLQRRQAPLVSGSLATMDSPLFRYFPEDTWAVSEVGADPGEPTQPDLEAAGIVEFDYLGEELDLLVATGNFWGFMLVTVDGKPANLLPQMSGKNLVQRNSACMSGPGDCEELRTRLEQHGNAGYKIGRAHV